ncbi:helix-turn-helix transcriptional regulator [Zoogloea sp.]|uniref:AraC family transcriptional regulator n=1 Tax=Zoogloea sp. TaxID=49181 RepID=UPI0026344590|nr:helix-turn-helix transcriptional regulator [Zoogloea sp.]MDD3353447.1 helix-turn-helix transcriptional regulator [Zoogloea sp.]
MRIDEGWSPVAVPDMASLPGPVFLRSQCLPARHIFPVHSHRWNQLVYATAGTLVVTVADSWYVITPEQAIWVPTGVEHTTGALHGAEFRNLYVADQPGLGMPGGCTVLSVTPFLRALIVELDDIHKRGEEERYIGRINQLILDQLRRLPVLDFHLPWPKTPMLQRICEALYASPADPRSVEDWGAELGASGRTLARRFEKEIGMGLREWRHRLRLFRAVEWLAAGRSVTEVALELGYGSTSAFTFMFRQEMGCSPTEWKRGDRSGFPPAGGAPGSHGKGA